MESKQCLKKFKTIANPTVSAIDNKQYEYKVLKKSDIYNTEEIKPNFMDLKNPHVCCMVANQCTLCMKTFTRKGNLKRHILDFHTAPIIDQHISYTLHPTLSTKHYICETCNGTFHDLSNFKSHMDSHNRYRAYVCKICNQTFSKASYLKRHLPIHTGVKPHACDLCNREFLRISDLRTHFRVHTGEKPNACDWCEKAYSSRCDLKRHVLTHTGERPYVCVKCKKGFTYKKNLVYHMRTHKN